MKPKYVALVGLEAPDELESVQRPDKDLAGMCAGEYVLVADGESQHRVVMLELLDALWGVELVIGRQRETVRGGGEGGCGRHGRVVRVVGVVGVTDVWKLGVGLTIVYMLQRMDKDSLAEGNSESMLECGEKTDYDAGEDGVV